MTFTMAMLSVVTLGLIAFCWGMYLAWQNKRS